ncbi:Centromere protein S [Caenorhabditis elegans]|nr:Centromere protein S [Caenorhabditis elegans]CCD31143.1 Centromere protein S [Caenorhabditis elegans]|eukprot:NP_001254386.1 Uncharacterized protein CELE_Y48E1C.1 [Caenorhabditis elegans]
MVVEEDVVSQVGALVWDTVAQDWADDLARFVAHAGRQRVNMDDISLLTRRNPDLLRAACELAGVDCPQETSGGTKGKPRKRKKDDVTVAPMLRAAPSAPNSQNAPLLAPIQEEDDENDDDDEITILDDQILHTPQQKSYSKKAKFSEEEAPSSRKRISTSTPKTTAERTLKFPDEITPIRQPNDLQEIVVFNRANLSAIEEEEQQDSFDAFGTTGGNDSSSKTITNTSSLLRQAEEHRSSIVEPTKDRIEKERLDRLVPDDEEFENASVDSFDNFNAEPDPAPAPALAPVPEKRTSVFSKKICSFDFDDDDGDDSFDEPVVVVAEVPKLPVQQQKTPKASGSESKKKPEKRPESSTPSVFSKKNKTIQLDDHDSFDDFDFGI